MKRRGGNREEKGTITNKPAGQPVKENQAGMMKQTGGETFEPGKTQGGRKLPPKGDSKDGDAAAKAAKSSADHPGWIKVRQQLQAQLGTEIFNSWFGRIKLVGAEGGVAVHSVPTAFLKSWINSHYRDLLLELWQKEDKSVLRADVIVRSAIRRSNVRIASKPEKPEGTGSEEQRKGSQPFLARPSASGRGTGEGEPGFTGSPLDPRHTFANFIEGKSNRMVYAAARSVAEGDGSSVRFNPLFIHANVGLGKTHLLQAIAWETRLRDPSKKVRYLTADYFMWVFAKALHNHTALSLKETLRDIDLLLIDDMQFLQGKAIQAEFCHLLNELIDSARQVVVAADRPPTELESLNERVRSRLKGGVALDIETPDYELRKSILNMRYEEARRDQPGLEIPEDIRHYVARQVNTSCRDIDGAFNQLLLQHRYSDGPEGYEELDKMLRHLIRSGDHKRVRIEDIQRVVARQFNVARNDLLSNRRTQQIVRPRQIAMYLSKVMTPRSLPEIGRRFGGRDHTTVLHAVRKIEDLMSEDHKLAQEIELLKRLILD